MNGLKSKTSSTFKLIAKTGIDPKTFSLAFEGAK